MIINPDAIGLLVLITVFKDNMFPLDKIMDVILFFRERNPLY